MNIAGRTLLERVFANAVQAARLAGHCRSVVATDDQRIADHARDIGAEAIMTPASLASGSARAHAAAEALAQGGIRPTNIICLQGDAPFIAPDTVAALIDTMRKTDAKVATPVHQLSWERLDRLRAHKQSAPFSGTTCLRDRNSKALWFSKTILPAIRDEATLRQSPVSPVWQHLGLYAYTREALEWFVATPQGTYESLEGLEQLRFLEHGWEIATVPVTPTRHAFTGIDTPQDLALAEEAIAQLGDPFPL